MPEKQMIGRIFTSRDLTHSTGSEVFVSIPAGNDQRAFGFRPQPWWDFLLLAGEGFAAAPAEWCFYGS